MDFELPLTKTLSLNKSDNDKFPDKEKPKSEFIELHRLKLIHSNISWNLDFVKHKLTDLNLKLKINIYWKNLLYKS